MPKTLLLADDSSTIHKIVELTFSGEGIHVVTVGNGEAALKKINEIHPDVILADIFMPGKNGYEVCEYIKNTPELQHIPVILLVGLYEPFDTVEAARVKADGHLTKPFFSRNELISKVNSLVSAGTEVETTAEPAPAEDATLEPAQTEDHVAPVVVTEAPAELSLAATAEVPADFVETVKPSEEASAAAEPPVLSEPVPPVVEVEVPAIEPFEPEVRTEVAGLLVQPQEHEELPQESPVELVPTASQVLEAVPGEADSSEPRPVPEVPAEEVPAADIPVVASSAIEVPAEPSPVQVASPIVLEEADPLGLYAEDSVYAAVPSRVSPETKSFVVDIWESKAAPAVVDEVLPELVAQVGAPPAQVAAAIQPSPLTSKAEPLIAATSEFKPVAAVAETVQAEAALTAASQLKGPPIEESAEQPIPHLAEVPAPAAVAAPSLNLEDTKVIDIIARKVVERLSREAIERIAWEVVPDLAEIMIKEHLQSHLIGREKP